jgi:short-subunit dehydrogenase
MFFKCCSPVPLSAALAGRVALVTGASAGIGREFARQLAPHVRQLVLVARRPDRLEELRKEIARPGLEVQCHEVDLRDRAALEAFLAEIKRTGLQVDVVINNAGLGDHGYFETSDFERVEAMIEVNIRAGNLPPAESDGVRYLKIPVRLAS